MVASCMWCVMAAAGVGLGACASLLDIPDDPRLEPAEPGPVLGSLPGAAGATSSTTPSAAEGSLSPSTSSEVGGAEVPLIAEQMMPSTTSPSEQEPAAGTEPDAGNVVPPDESEPGPSAGAGGAGGAGAGGAGGVSGQEPQPPSPCGEGRSQGPNGRCFALISEPLPWADARESCRELGAGWDLAVARSAVVNDFLATLISDEAWLGGTDQNTEGVWRWVDDGSIFWEGDEAGAAPEGAFANWNGTEPNGGGNSDCVRLVARVGNEWADLECEMPRSALCEGPAP